MSARGWALFGAMCVIWGIPYLLIKVSVAELSPVTLVALRTAIGGLILLPLAAARGSLTPLLRHRRWVLAYTAVEVAVPWLLLTHAETRLSSSLTGLMVAGVPFVGAVLAWLAGTDEVLDRRRVAGLCIGVVGLVALLGLDLSVHDAVAVVEMLVVTVGYAVGPVIVVRRLRDVPSVGVVVASLLISALVYLPFGIAFRPQQVPSGHVILSLALLGVVCTALAFVVFFALIAEVGPVRATVITYVNPAVALVLGVVLLGEALTAGKVVGFALILAGSVLATRRSAAPRPAVAPVAAGSLRREA